MSIQWRCTRWLLAVTGISMLPMPWGGSARACDIEHAQYRLRGAPGFTLDFRDLPIHPAWPSGVVLVIHAAQSGRRYGFVPDVGNGQGITTHVISMAGAGQPDWVPPENPEGGERPLGELDYLVADQDYRFDPRWVARQGAPAPAHIFMPGLQQAFWYRTPADAREAVPIAFFDRMGCRPG